ncbi:MAG: site-specific DNA-methyltransferase [Myxococcota bacterium]|nr:site-specific DNA-methyltransferase [Myxococcota bacterium]
MQTTHRLLLGDARELAGVDPGSVQLVLTSPPYPMVQMWDPAFGAMDPRIQQHLADADGLAAFEAMHAQLDAVWARCVDALIPGGFCCINIGDATRSLGGQFRLFHNHARIVQSMVALGMSVLPDILWRKPTNAPSKFMGSGMLPAGAYVTYEHEYVLIFRKGGKRAFSSQEQRARRSRSAYFWEERNLWFSDLWELHGARQKRTSGGRDRSAAFPLELPYRLIQMYSVQGDCVLDPFVGTGTTLQAALASGRSSVGVEIDPELAQGVLPGLEASQGLGEALGARRLRAHQDFVRGRLEAGKDFKHASEVYAFPVVTRQERTLELLACVGVERAGDSLRAEHARCTLEPSVG